MAAQTDAVSRFTEAWTRGDDHAINEITIEITQGGSDADVAAMVQAMTATPYGDRK